MSNKYDPVEEIVRRIGRLSEGQQKQLRETLFLGNIDNIKMLKEQGKIIPIMEGSSLEEVEEQVVRGDSVEGISSGYWTIDRMTAGFAPGELTVISAESGLGKTNFCTNMIARQMVLGHKILFITLENTVKSIRRRLRLIMGKQYFPILISENNLFVQAHVTISPEAIKYAVQSAKEKGVEIVYIDHLQYLDLDGDNIVEATGAIVRNCKTLCQEYDLPIILVSQMRKIAKGETSGVDDLYGSVKIRQTADIILLGSQTNEEFFPHLKMTVHKQRDRVLWRRFSSVILKQYGFNLEEPSYNEQYDASNDITGIARGKGAQALSFLE